MSNADPEYYKIWKAKLYSVLKFCSTFVYNIHPLGSLRTFAVSAGSTPFSTKLRRGPCFWQSGFRGTVSGNANITNVLKNVYLTQKSISGYMMLEKVSLAELFGGSEGMGDSYRSVKWQWIEGEQMDFVIDNPLNLVFNLSICLFGRNVYASK
jgi:hypothetical protein